ncbi:MAG: ribonuclease III [Candidatus Omnitrophica bacterium]|nr:ribonuclease III [Candidatus Omnitrophota bacterium]
MPLSKINLHKKIKSTFKISFKNSALFESALYHPSYRNEISCPGLQDFDRLEFLGDTILNFVICKKLFEKFPQADEGDLSKLRSILVSRKVLFRVAKETKFSKLVHLSRSLDRQSVETKAKILADSLEAFIAALFFDQGLEKTEKFILKYFKPYIDPKRLARIDPNPKSTLQEIALREWQRLPVYDSKVCTSGIETLASVGNRFKAKTSGRSRQESEQKAARILVRKIRQALAGRSKKTSSRRKLRKAA